MMPRVLHCKDTGLFYFSAKELMMIFENLTKRFKKRSASMVGLTLSSPGVICPSGYTRLSDAPEVAAAVWRISDMIASMTIHLMENAKNGDVRVKDELARKVDVAP